MSALALETRLAVEDLLVHEAELLDDRRFVDWLALLTEDILYTAPIKVMRKRSAADVIDDIGHFDDTWHSLALRVQRLSTDVAWAEDPPSHTRRMVSNIRVAASADDPDELDVRSNLLLFRSRGDYGVHDLIAGERFDRLRHTDDGLRICRRRAVLDQASVGAKNLGVFL